MIVLYALLVACVVYAIVANRTITRLKRRLWGLQGRCAALEDALEDSRPRSRHARQQA